MAGGGGGLGRWTWFGHWLVLGLDESARKREDYYICRCSCGTEQSIAKGTLVKGTSTRCKKCANSNNEKARIARRRPLPPGTRVGWWVILGNAGARGGNLYMRCRCDCGAEHDVLATMLRYGKSKSCVECARSMTAEECRRIAKEWGGVSPEYRAWSRMNERCRNPHMKSYARYGGRGIAVCEEWQGESGFLNFIEHIGPRPSEEYSLERVDNDRGYEPENVKWATLTEQSRNRSTTHWVTIDGVKKCAAEWAEEALVPYGTMMGRLRRGWEPRQAVYTASNRRKCG